jgi:hypothetical protein
VSGGYGKGIAGAEDVTDDGYMRWEVVDELNANATNVVRYTRIREERNVRARRS